MASDDGVTIRSSPEEGALCGPRLGAVKKSKTGSGPVSRTDPRSNVCRTEFRGRHCVSRSVIRPSPWFHLAVLLAFLGLEGVTAWARSATPAILGRYSPSWFAYQLVNLAILALLIASKRREGVRWVAYGLVIASTFVAASNDSVGAMPGVEAVLPLVRGLAALAIVAGEFDRFRGSSRSIRGPVLALGSTVVALSLLDLALWTGM
jgi:hypothetical protein